MRHAANTRLCPVVKSPSVMPVMWQVFPVPDGGHAFFPWL